jgi:multidrug transporter EmrE-like cation transporter
MALDFIQSRLIHCLSIAYPFLGISFIFTLLFGVFLLDEELSAHKLIGTLMIVMGCFLVAKAA